MDHQSLAQLLGNYGEFFGAIAVLGTLIYLSVQVRQANTQLDLVGRQARADAARDVLQQLSNIAPIAAKLKFPSYGDYGLDADDNIRFGAWCHSWMRTEELNFFAVTGPEERATLQQLRLFWMSTTWGREFWERNRAFYDESFAAFVDECGRTVSQRSASTEELMSTRR